jgi:uncharacterized protein YcbX
MYVGELVGLWRFPVKSMAGQRLAEADVSWSGVAGDRRWAFVRPGQQRNGFPWLTIRQQPRLHHYRPVLVDPDAPDRSSVRVATPAGAVLDIDDPALAAELGDGVSVMRHNRGLQDAAPVTLISVQSVAELSRRVGADLDPLRFRANLVVDAPGGTDFPEDGWVGRSLRIGSAVVRIDERDERCGLVNVNPVTLQREPAVLRAIAQERDLCLGVYGSVATPGPVRTGDPITLLEA